jgi:hypothetical protein
MSYDVSLLDPVTRKVIVLDQAHRMYGGTYVVGGTRCAELNITYNYHKHFSRVLDGGLNAIYGRMAAEVIPLLKEAASKLKDDVSENYWEPTEGNAKAALLQLLSLASLRPDGIFDIT